MPGYPSPPTTLADLYGHPVVDEDSTAWKNKRFFSGPCKGCPNKWGPDNTGGCAGFSSIAHRAPVTGELAPHDPEALLDYCDMFQRELQLLHCLGGGHGTNINHGNVLRLNDTHNWTEFWTLWLTAQADNVVTISYGGGYADPRHLPIAAGGYTSLQAGDLIGQGQYWGSTMGIVVAEPEFGASSCQVPLHKALNLTGIGAGRTITAFGDRSDSPVWFYPIPSMGVEGMCANCRIERGKKIATVKNWATTSHKCYYATGEAAGYHWYCKAMESLTLSEAQAFVPGGCANTECAQYEEQEGPWPPLPATFFNALVGQRDIWYVKSGNDWFTSRISGGIPSLFWLAGAPVYYWGGVIASQGANPTASYGILGHLTGSDKTFSNGVFGRGGTGGDIFVGGTVAKKSASGGISPGETIPGASVELAASMASHPLRLLPSASNLSYGAQPDPLKGEHAVQRVKHRQRTLTRIQMDLVAPKEQEGATVTAYQSDQTIAGFTYRLKIQLTRTGPFGEKTVIPETSRTVYGAATEGKMLRLDFYPGVLHTIHVVSDPPPSHDVQMDSLAGGGAVDPPLTRRVLNLGAGDRNKTGCVATDRATDGDALIFAKDTDWSFNVTRARAHYGAAFSGSWQGINSTTVPLGTGIPDDYEDYRLKMDAVWIEWDDSIGKSIIATPAQGDIVTLERKSVLAPKWANTGAAEVSAGHDVKVYMRTMGAVTEFTQLTQGTDYILDRATGLIYVSAAFCAANLASAPTKCLIVDAWFPEQSNEICVEFLEGMKTAITQLDGVNDGPGFSVIALRIRNPFTGTIESAVPADYWHTGCPSRPDGHICWPVLNKPVAILGSHSEDTEEGGFQECAECVEHYPGSYDGMHCTQTRAYSWTPSVTPNLDFHIVSASAPYMIGATFNSAPPGVGAPADMGFNCHIQMIEISSSPMIGIIPADAIKAAYVDILVSGGTSYTQTFIKPADSYVPTTNEVTYEEGTVHISASVVIATPSGDDLRFRKFGGVGAGGIHVISDGNWHTIEITAAAKMLADAALQNGERIFWLLSGPNACPVGTDFSSLFQSYVNSMSINFPAIDDPPNANWYYSGSLNASVDRISYDGMGLANPRIQLDWDWIRAHPELVPHVVQGNMPDLLTTF